MSDKSTTIDTATAVDFGNFSGAISTFSILFFITKQGSPKSSNFLDNSKESDIIFSGLCKAKKL